MKRMVLLALFLGGWTLQAASIFVGGEVHRQYRADPAANIGNPDRGFYDAIYTFNRLYDTEEFAAVHEQGISLIYAQLKLDKYRRTKRLPESLLNTLEKNLQNLHRAKIKAIFRIRYRGATQPDASLEVIEAHLKQLKPILQRCRNAVSVLQVGILGAWGEWHSFSGEFAEGSSGYLRHRRFVVRRLHEILPKTFLQIRTPMHKEQLFGDSAYYGDPSDAAEITPSIAYGDEIAAWIGHHDDCFLSDASDSGTYPDQYRRFWKNYVALDGRFSAVGGETCGIGETAKDRSVSDCRNALRRLRLQHYSFLNGVYHPDVLRKWRRQGCYETIRRNLGYRLVAKSLDMRQNRDRLLWTLTVANQGFASPYVDYGIWVILRNREDRYRFKVNFDIRKMKSGRRMKIRREIPIDRIAPGRYCMEIKIGKAGSWVRLANSGMWLPRYGSNRLICNLEFR